MSPAQAYRGVLNAITMGCLPCLALVVGVACMKGGEAQSRVDSPQVGTLILVGPEKGVALQPGSYELSFKAKPGQIVKNVLGQPIGKVNADGRSVGPLEE